MAANRSFLPIFGLVFILGVLNVSIEAKKKKGSRYFIRIVQLEDCLGQYSTSYVNITQVAYNGGGINGLFVVHEDRLPSKLMVFFDVSKCKTQDDASCEPYISGMIDWCKLIIDKNQFYSPFFKAFNPPMKCPIKKGTYEIKNGFFSYEAMEKFLKVIPAEYHLAYWKTKLVVTPPGKPERIKICYYLMFKYYPKRTR